MIDTNNNKELYHISICPEDDYYKEELEAFSNLHIYMIMNQNEIISNIKNIIYPILLDIQAISEEVVEYTSDEEILIRKFNMEDVSIINEHQKVYENEDGRIIIYSKPEYLFFVKGYMPDYLEWFTTEDLLYRSEDVHDEWDDYEYEIFKDLFERAYRKLCNKELAMINKKFKYVYSTEKLKQLYIEHIKQKNKDDLTMNFLNYHEFKDVLPCMFEDIKYTISGYNNFKKNMFLDFYYDCCGEIYKYLEKFKYDANFHIVFYREYRNYVEAMKHNYYRMYEKIDFEDGLYEYFIDKYGEAIEFGEFKGVDYL